MSRFTINAEYQAFLIDIKQRYHNAQLKAVYAVNREMIHFYWELGKQILEKQTVATWGSKFLEQLSTDLRSDFPAIKGFSVSNLERMRKFAVLHLNQFLHSLCGNCLGGILWRSLNKLKIL